MPSHTVSVTCRRLTCGPKFVSVVFLSIRVIPRTPIPHSSPPSRIRARRGAPARANAARRDNLRARRSCARGRGLRTRRPAQRTEAARRGGLRARKLLGSAACGSSPSSVPPSPPIPHSPPPTQDPTRRAANPRIRACAAAYGGPFLSSLPESELGAAACTARGRGSAGVLRARRPAQRTDAAQRGGLQRPTSERRAPGLLPNDGSTYSAEHRTSFPTTAAPAAACQREAHLLPSQRRCRSSDSPSTLVARALPTTAQLL
jgi:hypothetical protein